jgi:DNA-binding response OmpR family regulator
MIDVLLVDDQAFVGAAVGRLLAGERDIVLHYCGDPREAMLTANRIRPAVILQDLVMPDIDGLTLVGLFRRNRPTAGTPVIVLSGTDDPETRARAAAEGAVDYLVKLPDKATLVACIRRHAGGATAAAADEPASARAPSAARQPDTDATLDPGPLEAFREADAASGVDFTGTLIDEFMREAASQVRLLREAAAGGDTAALRATAHSLKGSSLTMGARRLAALCARTEARQGETVDAAALVTEIDREFLRVSDALAAARRKWDHT